MADATQTVLMVTVPTLAVLMGILVNNARLSDTNRRIEDINRRIDDLRQYFDGRLNDAARVNEAMFKMLLDKIEEIDTRLSRLEERFGR